ncbi:MAG TPA: isopenicillin N synthase family oxygenase [Acidimicrobiales bacterium]|nr:isopenicillin N synthase family oxygenase [Acidimicrobiales bacterium]
MGVPDLPVIDVSDLVSGHGPGETAREIDRACREVGFFYISGHGVDPDLIDTLDRLSREFFALPPEEKAEIAMEHGGRAWRGWFPTGAELTSGVPDVKEGLYLGTELGPDHPRVRAGTPLHGANRFPRRPAGFGGVILSYIEALTSLGHALIRGISTGLGLGPHAISERLTADPTILFRIFHYPPAAGNRAGDEEAGDERSWGVGEHTDYGLLTILRQDDSGGLEVRLGGEWTPAPPIPGTFVCNIGDMLERLTGGAYVSTPHRVVSPRSGGRLSFPFFFDPGWDARVVPVVDPDGSTGPGPDAADRWDGTSVHRFEGSYGEYLTTKVSRVFPELFEDQVI